MRAHRLGDLAHLHIVRRDGCENRGGMGNPPRSVEECMLPRSQSCIHLLNDEFKVFLRGYSMDEKEAQIFL